MAQPDNVTGLPRPLPAMVELDPSVMPMHTPRETSLLKAMTGRSLTELTAGEDADDGDRERVLVWFALRRLGFEPTWEQAGDVLVSYSLESVNPPSGGPQTNSPPSAGTGG